MFFKKNSTSVTKLPKKGTAHSGPMIGVDISNSAVKMVQLSQKGKGYHVDGYSIVPLPKDIILDGRINNIDALTQHIQMAWQKQGGGTKSVVAALPNNLVTFKTFTHPASEIKDLETAAEFEASQVISLDEVNLDFQILGSNSASVDELDVLLCAARKEAVDDCIDAFSSAGLNLSLLDAEAFATVNATEFILSQFPGGGMNQTVAVFDIGATRMQCHVVRNGRLLYYKDQGTGGYQLSRDIQRRYNMNFEEAERAKISNNLPAGYEIDVCKPFVEGLVQEILRVLQFFYTTVSVAQYQQVDMILLAGGTSMVPSLEAAVQAKTQINTMVANPFANLSNSSSISLKQLVQDAPALLIAFGLALRRFS